MQRIRLIHPSGLTVYPSFLSTSQKPFGRTNPSSPFSLHATLPDAVCFEEKRAPNEFQTLFRRVDVTVARGVRGQVRNGVRFKGARSRGRAPPGGSTGAAESPEIQRGCAKG